MLVFLRCTKLYLSPLTQRYKVVKDRKLEIEYKIEIRCKTHIVRRIDISICNTEKCAFYIYIF